MNPAENQTAWLELAKLWHKAFADRTGREWKVSLGLWALIVAAIAKNVQLPWEFWIALPFIYGIFWLRQVSASNKDDKLLRDHYAFAADTISRDPTFVISAPPPKVTGYKRQLGWLIDWSILFQFIATFILVIAAILIIQSTPQVINTNQPTP
jgi:hypothetical protein